MTGKFLTITIRDRGPTPRKLAKAMTAAKRAAWLDVATRFHAEYRDRRFTHEHAREAGYTARKGELQARGSKAFRNSYTGQKLRIHRHTRPLEFSGDTRRAVRFARISSTTAIGRVAYSGAGKFNFRHPKSQIRMGEEFRRITRREAFELGEYFDLMLDRRLKDQEGI